MFKRLLITAGGLATAVVFAQPAMFQTSTSTNPQQQDNPLKPPMSADDFKNGEKGVKPLAQKNLDNLNKQLTDLLKKEPPPSLPEPPKIQAPSGTQTPPPAPESIKLPEGEATTGAPETKQNATPATPGAPTIPPPTTQSPPPQQPGAAPTSEAPQTYTGFQGIDQNKTKKTTPASGGGFNIKY